MRPCKWRGVTRAFTLVELLVVVAILAVLMAILLPAVQMVRSAGRRTDCGNNLRQLAKGITSFHNRNGSLPPFWGAYPYEATQRAAPVFTSWLGHVLPDIEMQSEYLKLPKAKVCLGYRFWQDVPGEDPRGGAAIPVAEGLQRTLTDGVTFNVHNSTFRGGQAYVEGNVNITGTTLISGSMAPGGTTTIPTYKYETIVETAFGMNGATYTVRRTKATQIGTVQQVSPPRWIEPRFVGTVDARYGQHKGVGSFKNFNYPYFNLPNYPAAQEAIRVPLTVCKGDNSVIESSTKLPWLGGRQWSTTNYLANPHVFAAVNSAEASQKIEGGSLTPQSPFGTGRYQIESWRPRSFDHVKDGQANTILLAEAMRYCSSVVYAGGASFPTPVNRYVDMARLAFWSSPRLGTVVDVAFDPNDPAFKLSQYLSGGDWRDVRSSTVRLAIEPHPGSAGRTNWNEFPELNTMPRPSDVEWKPWTHSFGIEWESDPWNVNGPQYANTFMFQSQPKPQECSAIRSQANHGDILMVAMCDGSVRPIKSSVSRREKSDSDTEGKQVGRDPNMGGGPDASNKSTEADGVWDMLMRANDGKQPRSE